MQVAVDAHRNGGGISAVHGNLMRLDPALQQYLAVSLSCNSSRSWAFQKIYMQRPAHN